MNRDPLPIAIMAVVNLTPDSFSGDGLLSKDLETIAAHAQTQIQNGADLLDLGAESSRPGAKPLDADAEMARLMPVLSLLAERFPQTPISIDTRHAATARAALAAGARIINDISGLKDDSQMAPVIAQHDATVVIMDNVARWGAVTADGLSYLPPEGAPATADGNSHAGIIKRLLARLEARIAIALDAGISSQKIIIDPGVGFGKSLDENLAIMGNLHRLHVLGFPVLLGSSRKSFLGRITGITQAHERVSPSVATAILALHQAVQYVRVHDVAPTKQALQTTCACLGLSHQTQVRTRNAYLPQPVRQVLRQDSHCQAIRLPSLSRAVWGIRVNGTLKRVLKQTRNLKAELASARFTHVHALPVQAVATRQSWIVRPAYEMYGRKLNIATDLDLAHAAILTLQRETMTAGLEERLNTVRYCKRALRTGNVAESLHPQRLVRCAQEIDAALSDLPDVICHGDLHADNILVTPEQNLILFDWEYLCRDHSLRDPANFALLSLDNEADFRHWQERWPEETAFPFALAQAMLIIDLWSRAQLAPDHPFRSRIVQKWRRVTLPDPLREPVADALRLTV